MRALLWFLCACSSPAAVATDAPAPPPDVLDAAPDAAPAAALTFCAVTDPRNVTTAWTTTTDGAFVNYTCAQPCSDWTQCQFGYVDSQGGAIMGRNNLQLQALAFVVDGMGGHFVFSQDGTDVVVTHAGSGGITSLNAMDHLFLQNTTSIRTVTLGWAHGTDVVFNGGGWFTRKDATPTSVRALVGRPAAALQWVHDHLVPAGGKLATIGSSMGTAATLGSRLWYGLDSILDYQLLIGGPGFWDVNAGCGRVHIAAGFCDVDGAPCAGNGSSSYGDNDPTCGTTTNSCRVPTVMAPLAGGQSAYNNVINYDGMTTACAPQATDARDATLDESSFSSTVTNWSLHGRIDFVTNEGGVQPPNADQGMGEGHMLYLYNAITSAKGWTDNEGHHHGDSFDKDPVLMAASAQLVIDGLK